jgi:hypothetical protein
MPCPGQWAGWDKVRDEFLRADHLNDLHGPLIGFGRLPTTSLRPSELTVENVEPLVQEFLQKHPPGDERWAPHHAQWSGEAWQIRRALFSLTESEQFRPPTTKEIEERELLADRATKHSTHPPQSTEPPKSAGDTSSSKKKKRDTP